MGTIVTLGILLLPHRNVVFRRKSPVLESVVVVIVGVLCVLLRCETTCRPLPDTFNPNKWCMLRNPMKKFRPTDEEFEVFSTVSCFSPMFFPTQVILGQPYTARCDKTVRWALLWPLRKAAWGHRCQECNSSASPPGLKDNWPKGQIKI